MNIFKFHIELETKNSMKSIKNELINIFASKVSVSNYSEYVKSEWKNIKKDNISAIYPDESLLTYVNKSKCYYFIVDIRSNCEIDNATMEVFVMSELNDIKDAFNIVYNDLYKKIKRIFKLSLIDKQALLYIYDGSDIVATHVMIKADVISFTRFTRIESIRCVAFGILTIIFIILSKIWEKDPILLNIMYSLAGSCIFFIISEFLVKLSFSKTVEIKNFTNWVKTEEKNKIEINQNNEFRNPEF